MATIGSALVDHARRTTEMLKDAIRACPEDLWRAGGRCDLVPARWALHAATAIGYYASMTEDGSGYKRRFDVNWEESPVESLPSKDEVVGYLDDLMAPIYRDLGSATDHELLGPSPFHWTGDSLLGLALYAIRHTQVHTGHIDALVRAGGGPIPDPDWR